MKHPVYLFDLDGTLVNSMPAWATKIISILENYGVEYPKNIIEIITPLGDVGCLDYFRNELGMVFDNETMLAEMHAAAVPAYRDTIPFKEGVREYLEKMKAAGHRLNVLTASPHSMLDVCLKRLGVFDMFENVWSCGDFDTSKADPEIYRMVAAALGVAPEDIAFFDDNINVIKTAKSVGVYTVGIYDETGAGFCDELKKTADHYFETLRDAPEV